MQCVTIVGVEDRTHDGRRLRMLTIVDEFSHDGYIESFNARLRDELLNGEIFYTLREVPRSSSRAGGAITMLCGRMPRSATNHQHRRSSYLHSPRGRLRSVDRLRRPR